MKSVMKHDFGAVPQANIKRSSFKRSCGFKGTFNSGYLIPVYREFALPGDTFKVKMSSFSRLATAILPPMDNAYLEVQFFACPMRLVWDNTQKFFGERIDPDDDIDYLIPQMVAPAETGYAYESLSDYLGIPPGVAGLSHSSLWHRMYNLVWNEWYRSQDLQDSVVVDRDDGPDDVADYVLLKRNKARDYFTSCLPWPQKGDAIELPLSGDAPVKGIGTRDQDFSPAFSTPTTFYETGESAASAWTKYRVDYATSGYSNAVKEDPDNLGFPGVYADLSAVTASTINALRQAFQLQRMLERDARGGTRYTEIIQSHFNVTSPDSRLQRPEYLGGGRSQIAFHPVPQTSSTDNETPQANLAAYALSSHSGDGFVKSFTEHTLLLGLVSVRCDLNYQQGLERSFSWRSREEMYWPTLAHLGEQAVLRKEIYATGNPTSDDVVFGYTPRYDELRHKPSIITGKFRSTHPQSLEVWHFAQVFSTAPVLDSDFIEENPPIDRVLAIQEGEPEILFDAYFDVDCVRPIPMHGIPGYIDRF